LIRRDNRARTPVSAFHVYLGLSGAQALFSSMYFVIATVWRVQAAGLDPLQLVLVGTVMESSILVFEIPTGVVADVFSRRLSIIVGVALMGVAFLIEALLPHFLVILAAEALWGAGYTFTSGATEAWIAGEVGEREAGNTYMRGSQAVTAAALVGSPLGALLAGIHLNLGMLTAGVGTLGLSVALIALMPETSFRRTPAAERTRWQQMGDTLRAGGRLVRLRPALLTILGVGLFLGLYSEGYDRLSDAHFLQDLQFPPLGNFSYVVWFGIMDVGAMLLSLVASELVRRRVNLRSHVPVARALLGMTALLSLGVIGFGLARSFALAVLAVWLIAVLRRTISPLYYAWIAQHTDPAVRATVISMAGQVDAFGQIAAGPALGALGTLRGLRVALVASGALLAPAVPLLWRATRHTPVYPVAEDELRSQAAIGEADAAREAIVEQP
jgi:MFS transporter, DHA3 family, tetracycline resistance protein